MKADLTRTSFHPLKHYARVVMQQGRVQLDADWNEQVAIILRYMRALATDVYGRAGGPPHNRGFTISAIADAKDNFSIGAGHYYVDGILCECEADPRVTYLNQPDYPIPVRLGAGKKYQVYLDVWERLITYVEDDSIREVALGGPDTAARAKIVWQVKVMELAQKDPKDPEDGLSVAQLNRTLQGENRGRLKARAKVKSLSTDPCVIPPDARYRGPENQLYRVEVHSPGAVRGPGASAGEATFKWSRENGCVVFPIVNLAGTKVTLENLGRDDRFGLAEGDWVEVEDDDYVLQNRPAQLPPAPLLRVESIDRSAVQVTLSGTPAVGVGIDPTKHPLLRRWDQEEGDPAEGGLQLRSDDNAALIVEDSDDTWLDLENGIQIQFKKPDSEEPNQYRTGDYWLIPARTATGDVQWPTRSRTDAKGHLQMVPIALPPAGVTHHYAPLATFAEGQVEQAREVSAPSPAMPDWMDKPG
jgi:hypothetical protein